MYLHKCATERISRQTDEQTTRRERQRETEQIFLTQANRKQCVHAVYACRRINENGDASAAQTFGPMT